MKAILAVAAAWAAGAATMYYLDPHAGRHRRALARDRLVALSHDAGDLAQRRGRRAARRLRGMVAAQRAQWNESMPRDDEQLRERVRSRLGHVVSYPGAIEVDTERGCVTLRGPILAEDVAPLVRAVQAVPGVFGLDNRLTVHDEPGNVPELQGARRARAFGRSLLPSTLSLLAWVGPTALVFGAVALDAWRGEGERNASARS